MIRLDPRTAALNAVAAHPQRPATATIHDSDDVRLVVFRIEPGQAVAPHRSPATVLLTVLDGTVQITTERDGAPDEIACTPGDVVHFAPNEVHGMRADNDTALLLATITPRPGTR